MARALIVGCGCRGRALSVALGGAGHTVRGTTRDPSRRAAIEASGAEAVVGDPDRLGTLMSHVEGVSVLCWLMGTAGGEAEAVAALHGPRLQSLLDALVDTPVRGVVYEAAGSVPSTLLERGAKLATDVGHTHRMPVAILAEDPSDHSAWIEAATTAVERVLSH